MRAGERIEDGISAEARCIKDEKNKNKTQTLKHIQEVRVTVADPNPAPAKPMRRGRRRRISTNIHYTEMRNYIKSLSLNNTIFISYTHTYTHQQL